MARELSPNRWNWSQKDERWVFIKINEDGEKEYFYQVETPEEFNELTLKIKELNEKLIMSKDSKENDRIFNEMIKISKRMQCMGSLD
ncbi:MAG: hypothetical protein EU542_01910 [Promethearchaeota archaeon]|nr:MAG: hypothetical protein EU542_01910 [Candidatus Lokiarchaeota archaeon]